MFRRVVTALAAITAVFVAACPASARDWVVNDTGVGGDAPNIQAAIDSAANGDNVILNDGIFRGSGNRNVDFKGKAITVTSANGSSSTIINCDAQDRAFLFVTGEDKDSILRDITIMNGFNIGDGGAILISNTSPTITDCIIDDCQARNGGGIYVWVDQVRAAPAIQFNSISNCRATNDGGGIGVGECDPTIDQNTISGCRATNGGGIYVRGFSAGPDISNNLVHSNTATANGGGVAVVSVSGAGLMSFTGNLVYDNYALNGGGVSFDESAATVMLNTVASNTASIRGSGLYFNNTGIWVWFTIVAFNSGSEAIYCSDASPTLNCCLVWNPGFDGGLACQSSDLITEDPQFCGEASSFNYFLQSDSPAAAPPHPCGQRIGALGVNCGDSPADAATWGSIKAMYE